MATPFFRSIRRTVAAAAGIASLLGPGMAQAHCIDFDGNKICADHDDDAVVPDVHGKPVDTSTETYHAPPSPPPSESKRDEPKRDEPPPQKSPEHKFVKH